MRVVWTPCLFVLALAFLLAACGNAGSTVTGQGTASSQTTQTSTSTSPTLATSQQTTSTSTSASKPIVPLRAIRMLDTNNGWALTTSSILKTADGGVHWKDVTPANAGLNSFATGDFFNDQYAWIAVPPAQQEEGPGISVLRTTDGGVSWQRAQINDPLVSIVDIPHFIDAQQGWIEASSTPGAGHAGADIWHSTDGGQTWSKISTNANSSGLTLGYVTGISFKDAQTGIATGNLGAGGDNSVPSVALTHDGGKTWQTISLPHLLGGYTGISNNSAPPVFFGNVVVLPVNVTVSNGNLLVLYRSNDSGLHWFQTTVAHITATNTYVLDTTHAWATDTQSGKFYSTTDGGTNWSPTSTSAYNLKALSFTDANTGWGVTSNTLLHTTDGGKTWQQIQYTIQ